MGPTLCLKRRRERIACAVNDSTNLTRPAHLAHHHFFWFTHFVRLTDSSPRSGGTISSSTYYHFTHILHQRYLVTRHYLLLPILSHRPHLLNDPLVCSVFSQLLQIQKGQRSLQHGDDHKATVGKRTCVQSGDAGPDQKPSHSDQYAQKSRHIFWTRRGSAAGHPAICQTKPLTCERRTRIRRQRQYNRFGCRCRYPSSPQPG